MSGVLLWVAVGVCGGVGALARHGVDRAVQSCARGAFPSGILVVNLSGAALLGLLAGAGASRDAMLLAGAAVLGSYTTFSTWMLDTERLWDERRVTAAVVNVVLGLAAGLVAIAAGRALGAGS